MSLRLTIGLAATDIPIDDCEAVKSSDDRGMTHVFSVTFETDLGDPSTGESFLVKENCCAAVVPYGAAPPLGDLCTAVEAG